MDGAPDRKNAKIVRKLDEGLYYVEVSHDTFFGTGPYSISIVSGAE